MNTEEMLNVIGRAETITTWMRKHGVRPRWDGEAFTFEDKDGNKAVAHRGDAIVRLGSGFYVRKDEQKPAYRRSGYAELVAEQLGRAEAIQSRLQTRTGRARESSG